MAPGTDGRELGSSAYAYMGIVPHFGSAGVLEVVDDWRGNTYRAVYTVRFAAAVFVLHVFQKNSTHGIATRKQDMDLIKDRLKLAEQIAKELPK